MKVNYIYTLYTQKVKEYLDNGFTLAPTNVSISGVDTHVKLTNGESFYSIRITSEYLNSFSEDALHEMDKKLSLKVIQFNRIEDNFEDDGHVLSQKDFYVLGDLLYTTTEAQQANRRIHDKRVQRFGNDSNHYEMDFEFGTLSRTGFKRGTNTVHTWVDGYGYKRKRVTNSITHRSMTF